MDLVGLGIYINTKVKYKMIFGIEIIHPCGPTEPYPKMNKCVLRSSFTENVVLTLILVATGAA